MNAAVQFAQGVRLRCEGEDAAFLLVPEGVVELSPTARAILELVNGERTVNDIAKALSDLYDAPPGEIADDVTGICDGLRQRGFLQS